MEGYDQGHDRYAILAFGAKTDYGSGAGLFDLVPEVLSGFCETVLGMSLELLAMKMETFMLYGGVMLSRAKH